MNQGTPAERIPDSPAPDSTVLRSRDLAEFAGTTPRALRHYHRIGLLPEVPRDPNGYRRYSIRDLVTLLRIRQLAGSGMPLRRIRRVLEMDRQSQDELLAELDRELAEQEQRLAAQRELLADLRRHGAHPAAGTIAGRPTATQQFDEDVWTLVTTSTDLDQDAVTALTRALGEDALAEHAARWYREFEELEALTEIEEDRALQLADRIADFADAVVRASGVRPTHEERPVMALVEQMEGVALSPAQQTVWSRFRTVIEQRWHGQVGAGDEHGGGTSSPG
jgi:DNA-binding transcriptional MerR regulator